MRLSQEWIVEIVDGSFWGVEWMPDAAAFYAQRWFPDDVDDDVPADTTFIDCPGPDLGLFDTLDTLELAIGGPIPPQIRGELEIDQHYNPPPTDLAEQWGHSVAYEICRTGRDGQIISTFAPPWADDPESSEWDPWWL